MLVSLFCSTSSVTVFSDSVGTVVSSVVLAVVLVSSLAPMNFTYFVFSVVSVVVEVVSSQATKAKVNITAIKKFLIYSPFIVETSAPLMGGNSERRRLSSSNVILTLR